MAPAVRERTWHPQQKVIRRADGGLEVRLPVGGPEVLTWVLSMGSHAEVVGPSDLRNQMRERLQTTLAMYANEGV